MDPYSIDADSNEFFSALLRRLSALLPNLQQRCYEDCMREARERQSAEVDVDDLTLTKQQRLEVLAQNHEFCSGAWMDEVERLFPRSSFVAARTHEALGSSSKQWYVVQLHASAEPIVASGWFVAADTFVEAVAYLVERCNDEGVFPDELTLRGQELTLLRSGKPFATVTSLMPGPLAQPDALKRARSTLLGLRKGERPAAQELARRVRTWPGLKGIGCEDNTEFVLPEPLEWLVSARELCEIGGIQDASQGLKQQVAAAVLGAHSWNHLAGGLADGATHLVSPWYVAERSATGGGPPNATLFFGLFDAFVEFMGRARALTGTWDRTSLHVHSSSVTAYLPALNIYRGSPKENYWECHSLMLRPCAAASVSEQHMKAAEISLAEAEDGLRDLFMVDRSSEYRFESAQRKRGLSAIAKEGAWRFGWYEDGEESHIEIALLDERGEIKAKTLAKARKTYVFWMDNIGQHVLTYVDTGAFNPIAVLGQCSASTVGALRERIGKNGRRFNPAYQLGPEGQGQRRMIETLLASDTPIDTEFLNRRYD